MIQDAINSAWATVMAQFTAAWIGLWAPISDAWPLWWSYGAFGIFILAALALGILIRLYLPSDWAKFPLISIFIGILTAIGWIFGRVTMYNTMKAKLDAAKAKKRLR